MKSSINTRNEFGTIDLTDEGRKAFARKIRFNIAKPWPGMKWFPEYGQWAINKKNAIRKAALALY